MKKNKYLPLYKVKVLYTLFKKRSKRFHQWRQLTHQLKTSFKISSKLTFRQCSGPWPAACIWTLDLGPSIYYTKCKKSQFSIPSSVAPHTFCELPHVYVQIYSQPTMKLSFIPKLKKFNLDIEPTQMQPQSLIRGSPRCSPQCLIRGWPKCSTQCLNRGSPRCSLR